MAPYYTPLAYKCKGNLSPPPSPRFPSKRGSDRARRDLDLGHVELAMPPQAIRHSGNQKPPDRGGTRSDEGRNRHPGGRMWPEGRKRGPAKPPRARPDRQPWREADVCRLTGREALRGSFMRQGAAKGFSLAVGPCRAPSGDAACGPPFGSDRPSRKSRAWQRSAPGRLEPSMAVLLLKPRKS